MTEQNIFLAALEIIDPGQREAYVNQACADDDALRRQVASLLAAHEKSGEFIDVPAFEQLAGRASQPDGSTMALDNGAQGEVVATPSDTQAESNDGDNDDRVLDFLQPSSKPGALGRLAHYEVLELLGQGGFGTVVKAFDGKLHRMVAIKIMSPQMAATSPARKRFLREARSSAAIRHENVVDIHAIEEQPIPFLVMEYIAGETLQQRWTGPLEALDVLRIGVQIANGLAAAHAMGKIHRDIKPANILLETGVDRVKLTDFGLARAADDASLTQSGVIAGTPMYMAPEQAQGVALDHRADLFSLGSVLYVMCSGRPPFRASTTLAVLKRVAEDTPRPIREIIPEVPQWLCEIITKLHAKNPEERCASAKEVAEILARCLAELQMHGKVQSAITRPTPPKPVQNAIPTVGVIPMPSSPTASRERTRPETTRRRLAIAAAIFLLALTGLGLTEATGVTDLRGTVIRLFSPEGTLIVEVDDPDVSVSIEGEELVIKGAGAKEIRMKPGQYKVQATKDGKVVRQELVTVTRNGRQVVRISLEVEPIAKHIPAKDKTPIAPPSSSGYALMFDGKSSVVQIPTFKFHGGDPLTIEGTFTSYEKVADDSGAISTGGAAAFALSHSYVGKDAIQWRCWLTTANLKLGRAAANSAKIGVKTHVAAIVESKGQSIAVTLFVNGRKHEGAVYRPKAVLEAMDDITLIGATNDGRGKGAYREFFHGLSHEVRISKGARYEKDFTPQERFEPDADTLALYHFDEGRGDKLTDSSGNGHHGKIVGARWVNADGTPIALVRARPALKLDAASKVDMYGIEHGTGDFTVEGFFTVDEAKTVRTLWLRTVILEARHEESEKVWHFQVNKAVAVAASAKGGQPLLGKRTHVAGVKTANEIRLFVDGRLVGKAPWTGEISTANQGGRMTLAQGIVEEVRISKVARYDKDFTPAQRHETDKDTLALYHCDEGEGNVLKDSSGNNHHGKIVGARWVNADGTPIVAPATQLDFTGVGCTIGFPKAMALPDSELTFEGYFSPQSENSHLISASKLGLHISFGSFYWFAEQKPGEKRIVAQAGKPFVKGQRVHVAGVLTSGELRLYVDGKLSRTARAPAAGWNVGQQELVNLCFGYVGGLHGVHLSKIARYDKDFTPAERLVADKDTLALFHCDEGQGDVLRDSSGNEHHGKIIGAKWVALDGTPISPDRKAAEMILARSPSSFFITSKSITIRKMEELPAGPLSIKDVVLMGNTSDKYTNEFWDALAGLENVKEYYFQHTPLTQQDLERFSRTKGRARVERLELVSLRIDDAGTAYLKEFPNLSILDIHGNSLSDAGLVPLQGLTKLTSLRIQNMKVTGDGVKKLAAALPACQIEWDGGVIEPTVSLDPDRKAAEYVLSIGGFIRTKKDQNRDINAIADLPREPFQVARAMLVENERVTDEGLAVFKGCRDVNTLHLSKTRLSDAGFAHFKDCKDLTSVGIYDTLISGDAALAQLKDCKKLQYLEVAGTNVTDAGLANLKDCTKLLKLNLSQTQVSDTGLANLKDCTELSELGLGKTQVTDAGLALFKNCRNLRRLLLPQTKVSDAGLVHLKGHDALRELLLKDTKVTAAGIDELKKALPQCRIEWNGGVIEPSVVLDPDRRAAEYVLSLGGTIRTAQDPARDITDVADLPGAPFKLAAATLSENQQLGDAGLSYFQGCKELASLDLSSTKVGDEGMAFLSQCKGLQLLSLGGTQVSDAGLANFKDCANLTVIALPRTKVSDAVLAHFNCKNLKIVNLAETQVGDAIAAQLKDSAQLAKLWLYNTLVSDAALVHLKGCANLRELQLQRTKVTAAGIDALKKALPQCKIEWDGGVIEPTVAALPAKFTNAIGMEFALIPKGKAWLMGGGDKPGTIGVEFQDDFYMGVYEVTHEDWEKVMGANPGHFARTGPSKAAVKDIPDDELRRFPIAGVSWDESQAFVAKLNELVKEPGWFYRLPRETEWEYVCRGGPMADKAESAFDYYLDQPGNTLLTADANFNNDLKRVCKVGSYKPNRLGLHDMHGNVVEWCDEEFPNGVKPAEVRISRGGDWTSLAENCRAMIRNPLERSSQRASVGLRLARVPLSPSR